MTTATETAKIIRAELKAQGITSRRVSVRSSSYSMGASVYVTVRDGSIKLDEVSAIATKHERIRRDELTGEILCGGNLHVLVQYDADAMDARCSKYLDACRDAMTALDEPTRSLTSITGTGLLLGHGPSGHFLSIGAQTIYVGSPEIAARYVAEILEEEAKRDAELEEGNAYPALRLVS